MKVVTKVWRAKNKRGKVLLIKESRSKRVKIRIKGKNTQENIKAQAKEIAADNQHEETIFLSLTPKGEKGFISVKYLQA